MSGPQTYRAVWRGIPLAITHTPNLWGVIDRIHVKSESCEPFPGAPNGYDRYYLCPEDLAEYAGPAAFVLEWLDFLTIEGDWTGQLELF